MTLAAPAWMAASAADEAARPHSHDFPQPAPMTSPDLPEPLLRLIAAAIPSFPAAEVLLLLSRESNRDWSVPEIVAALAPADVPLAVVEESLVVFRAAGLTAEVCAGRHRYDPRSAELRDAVHALAQAYNERPVTLIRTISRAPSPRIQSFADAFKLKRP